ncbi:MAG: hypothetical protein RJQ09_12620 [Cyclobacteriaceae bacterium]
MNFLIALVVGALVLQIVLFFMIRAKKKKLKDGVIGRYDIRTPADAWKLMNDQSIPEEDRLEIERIYKGEDET